MKVTAALIAIATTTCGVSAFAPVTPSTSSSSSVSTLHSVFDDYVGGIDLRGQKFEFDPVRECCCCCCCG
jgi:hypothetical protein